MSVAKKDLTNYFFIERFTKPISPLGWSFIGPSIEEIALKEPLRYLGLFKLARGKLIYVIDGIPYVKKEVFRGLFQIVPKKLITKDKLNSFMKKEELKDFNFPFVLSHFPFLFINAIRDWNWFPLYHFLRWKQFKKWNERFYETAKRQDLKAKTNEELALVLKSHLKQSERFLKLHRWSFVYSEVFYGILKGLVIRWVPTKDLDESIEIAEKLCSGFKENITARMDLELQSIADGIKYPCSKERLLKNLSPFLKEYGHRAESLDIALPTWAEDPSFVLCILEKDVKQARNTSKNHLENRIKLRKETTEFCINSIKKNSSFLTRWFKLFAFKNILYIAQRFMTLREVQRNEWHMILSQSRRGVIEFAQRFLKNKVIPSVQSIFYLSKEELFKLAASEVSAKEIRDIAKRRESELGAIKVEEEHPGIKKGEGKFLYGLGVSSGKIKGKAIVIKSFNELSKVKPGYILITKMVDSNWTPVFNIVSGLITEVGGMLSHSSVVARELGIPAIANVANVTKIIRNEAFIQMDGKSGEVVAL